MILNSKNLGIASVFVAALAVSACGGSDESPGDESLGAEATSQLTEEELALGELDQSLMSCSNPDGTNSVMAALGVATAKELGRWQPLKDFYIAADSSLQLTATGKAQCAGGNCYNTQALLDMQKPAANGKVTLSGGVKVNAAALRSRLNAKFGEQKVCESRPDNHQGDNCPAEQHKLTFLSSVPGACDTIFKFKATTPTGGALQYPAQLKNKLQWLDVTNPYVAFQSTGDQVSIDPTYGLNEDTATSAGSCSAACTKISATNVAGQCCTCSGATKKYAKSAWNAVTYLCQ